MRLSCESERTEAVRWLQWLFYCIRNHNIRYAMIYLIFFKAVHHFRYDPGTRLATCRDAKAASFPFPGVFLWENFISEEEEKELINTMDQDVWNQSQSGRRKQVMLNA